jgi:uncharacterized protein (TIGR03545 family)
MPPFRLAARDKGGNMARKAPGLLRKPLKEKKFDKLLKLLEQPQDKSFLKSCFVYEAGDEGKKNGLFIIKDRINEDDTDRLHVLVKAMKQNRKGPVNVLPMVVLAILVGGALFFFSVILNPLLARLLHGALQDAFEAKVELSGFRLGLVPLQIKIGSLVIANRDEPMKNLFESKRLEIRLKTQAVLRGKVYIETITAAGLQFGTDRKTSGALPQYAARIAAKKSKPPSPPMVDLANFDAQGLLDREWDKLATPKAYDMAITAYSEIKTKWEAQYKTANTTVKEVQEKGKPLLATNVANLKTPDEITKFVTSINDFIKTTDSAQSQVRTIVDGVQKDINAAVELERMAKTAITDDFNHLKSYLDLSSGNALEALEPSIYEILSDEAEQYVMYGRRALDTMEKVKALQAMVPKSEPKPPKITFKGRDVNFPTPAYPAFYLAEMKSDITITGWNSSFELLRVSSSPVQPTLLNLGFTEQSGQGRTAVFNGSADFSPNAQTYFSAKVLGDHFPLDIGGQLKEVGIGGFSGSTGFGINFSGGRAGSLAMGGDIRIQDPRIRDPGSTIAEAIAEAVADFALIELGIKYERPASGDGKFSLTSNLMDLIKKALQKTMQKYLRQAQDAIEKALRAKVDQYLTGKWVSKEEADQIFAAVKGDRAAVDSLKAALEGKKKEAEQKIKGKVDEAADKAKEQAKDKATDAAKGALKGLKF